jgi:hypothetical protein
MLVALPFLVILLLLVLVDMPFMVILILFAVSVVSVAFQLASVILRRSSAAIILIMLLMSLNVGAMDIDSPNINEALDPLTGTLISSGLL